MRGPAAVFLVWAFLPHHAEAREPSNPEERARFVALVRLLERDPLAENANAIRQQVRQWTIDVPDVRFKVCPTCSAMPLPMTIPTRAKSSFRCCCRAPSSRSRIPARPGTTLPCIRRASKEPCARTRCW